MNTGSEPQLAVGTWTAMMAVMMVPGAVPAALRAERRVPFLAIYLGTWIAFGVAAAGLQFFLESRHLLPSGTAAGLLLIAIGAYELSPWKHGWLQACHAAQIDGRHYSLACLGSSWALVGILFVVGVMNYVAIPLLAFCIAAEKYLSWGGALAAAGGMGLIAWGAITVLV